MNDVLMPSGEDKPVTGDVRYQAIQEGELVIRMFGMKDDDNLLTSHNVLSGFLILSSPSDLLLYPADMLQQPSKPRRIRALSSQRRKDRSPIFLNWLPRPR